MCNPAFADRPSWWDVLCNIETGKVIVSKDLRPSSAPQAIHSILHRSSRRIGEGLGGSAGRDGVDEMGMLNGNSTTSEKLDPKADSTDVSFMQEVRFPPNSQAPLFPHTADALYSDPKCYPITLR